MAKIKHTKNELKAQREALKRFERFLPMLQLKKQQLQVEILGIDGKLAHKKAEEDALRATSNLETRHRAVQNQFNPPSPPLLL